jgi:putative N6-adenine-specific DNA methylase
MAPMLEREVRELGYVPLVVFATGIEMNGTFRDCIRLNLNLRCASQVYNSIRSFRVNSPDELYRELVRIPWETILDVDRYFSVTSHVEHFTVNNNLFVNVKVKDAIVDRLRQETGRRPDTGPENDKAVIHLFWKNDRAEVFVDTSGETLARHGYRKIPGKAPMLESLASAVILATRWNRTAPFINPMCGSGTLAIEAAMIATGRVPGLFRENYGFMHVKSYDDADYKAERRRIESAVKEVPGLKIVASDISRDAIEISTTNATAAGVAGLIDFKICDFQETTMPDEPGVVIFNPEYGERLGDEAALEATYALIGDFMKKKCKGHTGYIFTGNLELAKKIGLKAARRIEFYSAKIDCRLLEYELYSGSKRLPG